MVPYSQAQDAYFLFTPRYLHYEDWYLADDLSDYPLSGVDTLNTGPLDIGLAASRDGMSWQRFDRKPWIALGPEGSFDSKVMYMSAGMFVHGNEIWMYHVGYDTLHGDKPDTERNPTMRGWACRKACGADGTSSFMLPRSSEVLRPWRGS